MRKLYSLFLPFIIMIMVCIQKQPSNESPTTTQETFQTFINPDGKTIKQRILTPGNFERISLKEESFGFYLRNLPLKPHGSDVHLYTGVLKGNKVHVAVIDMDIGNKDLQQCADAIIRLRSEYLYRRKLYGLIHFNFTNGFRADYSKWANGYRIDVNENQVKWIRTAKMSYNYDVFRKYLDVVFTYAGTYSLEQELVRTDYLHIQPGDIFIKGGSPGHAVIVVDVAVNRMSGQRIYLLAQSYMPAQDIHVLKNPSDPELSPWYEVDPTAENITTPEWKFYPYELRRFK